MKLNKFLRKAYIWLFWNIPFFNAIFAGISFLQVNSNGSDTFILITNLFAGFLNLGICSFWLVIWGKADEILGKDWREI